jgi:hypothetical protein
MNKPIIRDLCLSNDTSPNFMDAGNPVELHLTSIELKKLDSIDLERYLLVGNSGGEGVMLIKYYDEDNYQVYLFENLEEINHLKKIILMRINTIEVKKELNGWFYSIEEFKL